MSRKTSVLKTTASTIVSTMNSLQTGVGIINQELVLIKETNKLENIKQFAAEQGLTIAAAKKVLNYE